MPKSGTPCWRTGPDRPRASLYIRICRDYRAYFYRGLERLGYDILDRPVEHPEPNDILILWNRLPIHDKFARKYEQVGAKVVIAEHGWIGTNTYALCLGNHNGAGTWQVGKDSRWPDFGIEVKPWRSEGGCILVVPQRGIGSPPAAMPRPWPQEVVTRLRKLTDREIRMRPPQDRIHPFEQALQGVHAVVTWASGAGVKAIVQGVPVFYEMPLWIGALAARRGLTDLESPYLGERYSFLKCLSWAMWRPEEIESGEAIKCVLG